jgi:ribosomal protein S18 acetylase RimI-like enzyme
MIVKIQITKIIQADIERTKELIKEYLNWIDQDLSFQQIHEELCTFPEKYKEPDGSFFTAKDGDTIIGCAGLKKIKTGICEMKRLYIRDEYKGLGLGKELIKVIIEEAKKKGYSKIRLDTLPKMKSAQKLYKDFGFYEIGQYLENPIDGALFMEKILSNNID